ncbi:MAG: hypothetical protein FE835_08290, partial [Gammaproteobacteria bacterium]|nr:hypothetical protein [Gammaproteobacteria bacterium]
MAAESLDHNRMLLEIDRTIRDINRNIINPMIQACRDAQDAKRDVQVPLLPSLITT